MAQHKCIQGERLTKLETTVSLTHENVMEKIDNLDKKIDTNQEATNKKIDLNHEELKKLINEISNDFVLKREFKVALAIITLFGVIVGIVSSLK